MMIDWKDTRGRNFNNSIQTSRIWARQPDVFRMSIVFNGSMNLSADDRNPEQYPGVYISGADCSSVKPRRLGAFRRRGQPAGAPPIVLLSNKVWKSRYASDPRLSARRFA
jgi:hypothetical protein